MNCFYHPTTKAAGVCVNCGRGLCPACAEEAGGRLTCGGACGKRIRLLTQMENEHIRRSRSYRQARSKRIGFLLFTLAAGAGFGGWGFVQDDPVMMILGGVFLLYFLYALIRQILQVKGHEKIS